MICRIVSTRAWRSQKQSVSQSCESRFNGIRLQAGDPRPAVAGSGSPQRGTAEPAAARRRLSEGTAVPRRDPVAITNQAAANLASFGFICFLLGRFSGAALLQQFSAHKVVGLYGVFNVRPVSWSF